MLERLFYALEPGYHERYIKDGPNGYKKLVRVKFDVIGPAGSTTLIKMYKEATQFNNKTCTREYPNFCHNQNNKPNSTKDNSNQESAIRIISPRATIDEKAIRNSLNMRQAKF